MSNKSRSNQGFTLVELIIVIVVIAVLSTIGVVGFNSIGTRAEESKLQSDINGAIKKIAADMVDSETPPANADGLPKSEGVTYQYTQGYQSYRGEVYCITATSTKNGVKTYYSDNGATPREGACPGHDYGSGSPSTPSVVAPQKLNTFIANIKAHAQANGLTMVDYSTDHDDGPIKVDNTFSANPELSRGGHYNDIPIDADGYSYGLDVGDEGGLQYVAASVSTSGTNGGSTVIYMRPSDGMILVTLSIYEPSGGLADYTDYLMPYYLFTYLPVIASQTDTTLEQIDSTTVVDFFNTQIFGIDVFSSVSGGPGGPWVFGLTQAIPDALGLNEDVSSCRYNVSNVGQGYIKVESVSC